MTEAADGGTPNRQARRRARTRAALLAAVRAIVDEQGVDAVTVAGVTERADLGSGTFYTHFESKDDVLRAAVVELFAEQTAQNDTLTAALEDPAEKVAVGVRLTLRTLTANMNWLPVLVQRGELLTGLSDSEMPSRLQRDVAEGLASGRFAPAGLRTLVYVFGGALLTAARASADEPAPEIEGDLAANLLVALGVPRDEALEVAGRPLPSGPGQQPRRSKARLDE